jgi:peptidoglycan/xylan/chitin deacetylase (PgdA/CDA1 family)
MIQEQHVKGKVSWPGGSQLAVVLVFDFQGGEAVRLVPDGNIHHEDYTEAEYGPKIGIYRILRVLEEQGVPASFMTCGGIAERYPEAVKAIVSMGHEIGSHGYHHEVARNLSREEEKEVIQRTTEKIRDISGKLPVGWRTCTQGLNTVELLLEQGYLWNSNSFASDLPFIYTDGRRKLVEVPRQPFGDGYVSGGHHQPRNFYDALAIWKALFGQLYEESKVAPTFCPFTFHPYHTGRPGRAKILGELIQYMKGHRGVWFATGSEISQWWLDQVAK